MSTSRPDDACTDCIPSIPSENNVSDQPVTTTKIAARPASDGLDPFSMQPPDFDTQEYPRVVIEFCDRCRWIHRATWTQTELFMTFAGALQAITLVPRSAPDTGGRFRVWLYMQADEAPILAWDRKTEGGFPELKELKQRIRNLISPEQSLGHSDKKSSQQQPQQVSETNATAAAGPDPLDYTPRFKC
ncbi:hypothetical protein OIV83_000451 [Microbotryomycetes sp. JL201]|nr:hypothetical protein OIV83_000451 [Microbotryomycetes sp. JL201]